MQELLQNLNPEQQQAVTYGDGPLLIVAGAGTGKTTVITHRIAYLIEKGLAKPEEIIALAFTDKSAGEMEERVDKLLPYGYTNLWVSTFHAFCQKILEDYGVEIGLPQFKILDNTQRWLFFRKNFDKFDLDYYRPRGNPNKFIKALLDHISRLKDECISPQGYLDYVDNLKLNQDNAPECHPERSEGSRGRSRATNREIARVAEFVPPVAGLPRDSSVASLPQNDSVDAVRLEEVANAYHVYQNLLLENGYLDFGDLINYTIELFKTRPNVLEECRKKFKHILIDEFQDTNWAQYELIKLLSVPRNNLTVVGDDDQSIYKFRGASLSNILQFKNDFPAAKEVVLVKNYRSGQNILDLSYKFIKQNDPNRLEARLNLNKKLISTAPVGGEISHLHFKSLDDEADGIVDKITELHENDKYSTWDDFAILVRANDHAAPFCEALARRGIPYQFMSLKGLYTKSPILDILAYLKLLDNYHESAAFYRVLSWPQWKLTPADVMELGREAAKKTESFYEVASKPVLLKQLSETGRAELAQIITLISKHAALAREKTPLELVMSVAGDTGYLDYLKNLPDKDQKDILDYLNQFVVRIKKFEENNPNARINAFLEELNLEIESGEEGPLKFDPDIGPEMVRVMTVHSAKGLEFKYVFLVNLVDRRFPSTERREQLEVPRALIKEILPEGDIHLEEERRLFYVGLTRAKHGLYLVSGEDYGGARKKKLSRFLIELGFDLVRSQESQLKDFVNPVGFTKSPSLQQFLNEPMRRNKDLKEKIIYSPSSFSFTQFAEYNKCPLQYKFKHVIKIPVQGSYTHSFGKSIHETLREFAEEHIRRKNRDQKSIFSENAESAKKFPSFDEVLKMYQKNWINQWYADKKSKEEYFNKGKEILKNFYNEFVKSKPKVKFVEQSFTLKLGGLPVKGKIDRIDEDGDGIIIIDYKTGKSKDEESLNKENKSQLLIYQIVAEEAFRLKPKKLVFYYVEDGSRVEFLGAENEKSALKKEITETVQEIKKGDFNPRPGMHCKFCDFRGICEDREL